MVALSGTEHAHVATGGGREVVQNLPLAGGMRTWKWLTLPAPAPTWLLLAGLLAVLAGAGLYVAHETATPLVGIPRVSYLVRPASGEPAPLTCRAFKTQADAQLALRANPAGLSGLDGDNDGIACESLPGTERAGTRDLVPVGR